MRILNEQDYALLSWHVYGDDKGNLKLNNDRQTTLNGITYEVIEQKSNPQNGYFGAIYRRADTNELIVVHRGTDDARDGKTDMLMVRDKYNRQFPDAEALTQKASEYARTNYKNTRIYQTGHSLGGTLAQMCGYKYSQQTQTYNAYGAAELTEMRAINNPHAYQLITNHRMGGDFVAAAAPHLGKETVYAVPAEIRNLRNGGYGNGNPKDNTYLDSTIPVWLSTLGAAATVKGPAVGLYPSHRVTNFTDEGGLSVLSPDSPARRLAQENRTLFEEFRQEVQKTAREKPEQFMKIWEGLYNVKQQYDKGMEMHRKTRELIDQDPNLMSQYEPERLPQYAQARSLTFDDMPPLAQELCQKCRAKLEAYYQKHNIGYRQDDLERAALAAGVAAYGEKMTDLTMLNIKDGNIYVGHKTPQGVLNYASVNEQTAAATPEQDSIAQSKQAEIKLEEMERQRDMEILAYQQSQSMGRSI